MGIVGRFLTSYRGDDSGEAGLVQKEDGSVWLVAADGTETQLPAGGGSSLAHGAEIYVSSLNLTYDGPDVKLLPFDTVTVDTDGIADLANNGLVIPDGMAGLWAYGCAVAVSVSAGAQLLASVLIDGAAWNLEMDGAGVRVALNAYGIGALAPGDALTVTVASDKATTVGGLESGTKPRLFAHWLGAL